MMGWPVPYADPHRARSIHPARPPRVRRARPQVVLVVGRLVAWRRALRQPGITIGVRGALLSQRRRLLVPERRDVHRHRVGFGCERSRLGDRDRSAVAGGRPAARQLPDGLGRLEVVEQVGGVFGEGAAHAVIAAGGGGGGVPACVLRGLQAGATVEDRHHERRAQPVGVQRAKRLDVEACVCCEFGDQPSDRLRAW